MNGWGGPTGLDFACRHPERVKRLVIANTWCWPVRDDAIAGFAAEPTARAAAVLPRLVSTL